MDYRIFNMRTDVNAYDCTWIEIHVQMSMKPCRPWKMAKNPIKSYSWVTFSKKPIWIGCLSARQSTTEQSEPLTRSLKWTILILVYPHFVGCRSACMVTYYWAVEILDQIYKLDCFYNSFIYILLAAAQPGHLPLSYWNLGPDLWHVYPSTSCGNIDSSSLLLFSFSHET